MGSRSDFRSRQNNGSAVPPMAIPIRDALSERQRASAQVQNLHMMASLQTYGLLAREAFMGQEVGKGVSIEELAGLAEWSKFAAAVWLQAWGLMKVQSRDPEERDVPDETVSEPEIDDHPATIVLPIS